jgi:nucleotide-binding universal stress UspA family protein
MRKILIAVDGSKQAEAAALYAAAQAPQDAEIHLVSVQRPLGAYVSRFLKRADLREFHRARGQQALSRAEQVLKQSGRRPATHIHVGEPATTIARAGNMLGVDEIVVGGDGLGPLDRYAFKFFLARLMQAADAPVVVIKRPKAAAQTAPGAWAPAFPAAALDEGLAIRR